MILAKRKMGSIILPGIKFPLQLILTKELSEEQNLWLKSLTDDLEKPETAKRLIDQYRKHKGNNLYKSVMNLIVSANKSKFEEAKTMCEALEELMKDELEAKRAEGMIQGRAQGKAEGILALLNDLGQVLNHCRSRSWHRKIQRF